MDNRLLMEQKLLEEKLDLLYAMRNDASRKEKKQIKKEIYTTEEKLNTCYEKIQAECSIEGHDYGEWEEHAWLESVDFMGLDFTLPSGIKKHLFYVRKCNTCGYYECIEQKPNTLTDNPKILQKTKK
ncbi:MAG: hypothetical protein PHD10_02490 [Bacilli bacterium]|nr:hypothetical protein [Bacilli bacterium]